MKLPRPASFDPVCLPAALPAAPAIRTFRGSATAACESAEPSFSPEAATPFARPSGRA